VIKLLIVWENKYNKPSTLNNTNKSSAQEFITMDTSAKERARQSAIARSKPTNKGTPLSQRQGRTDGQGNQLTFFSEDSQGMKLSPQTVMLICLLYIGSVVVLHIFGKVKAASSATNPGSPQPDASDL